MSASTILTPTCTVSSFSMQRSKYTVQGHVQGVGFRPFIYREAIRLKLSGFIRNTHAGVYMELQGTKHAMQAFNHALETALPPLASIHEQTQEHIPLQKDEHDFQILCSQDNDEHDGKGLHTVLISPDVAPCKACLQEMFDPSDRRANYPFINCTDCGPRITITDEVPYDRHTTSMRCFPLCADCAKEYHDPTNRRFHAQPNACAVCGPHIWLQLPRTDHNGNTHTKPAENIQSLLQQMYEALEAGKILAIKGLGGFHFACDATNTTAITRLRERKHRPHKPLAVMVPSIEYAKEIAIIDEPTATQLESFERPIVLVKQRPHTLPQNISPDAFQQDGSSLIGIMLPSTPLHALILKGYPKPLVMTSGNPSGDPICLGNREALASLAKVADLFVLHNRDILIRQDDSVLTLDTPTLTPLMIRRSRGFMPRPLYLSHKTPPILAYGAMLKNTLCCTRDNEAFVSQHLGDLESPVTLAFFEDMAERLPRFLRVKPEALVADLHPDYPSTRLAKEHAKALGIPLIQVQHHVAHAYAVLAEYKHTAPALALCLDGVGLGFDNSSWGGELLFVHPELLPTSLAQNTHNAYARLGHIKAMPMPTGDADVRNPWRLAVALASQHTDIAVTRPWAWEADATTSTIAPHIAALAKQGHGFTTTSCGRLFDAVSALLGLCSTISYEGQAAIRLEYVAHALPSCPKESLVPLGIYEQNGCLELDTHALFRHAMCGWQQQESIASLVANFHDSLAEGLANLSAQAAKATGVTSIVLAGGVFHNTRLYKAVYIALQQRGLTPLCPKAFPPNDGSISLGQAAYANALLHL